MRSHHPSQLQRLEALYQVINRRQLVHPDPLAFLYAYESVRDREIVGLIAASLAYGRVAQILKSVGTVLEAMGPSPAVFLTGALPESKEEDKCATIASVKQISG